MQKRKSLILCLILFVVSFGCTCIVFSNKNEVVAEENTSVSVDASTLPYYCLRDDYIIYTQNQSAQGLCWDFAITMSLTTCMMINTNQYLDYSEGWVSLATSNSSEYINYKPPTMNIQNIQ